MPDPGTSTAGGSTLGIVADLTFEVGDDRRRTRAHLGGGPGTLILDVDDPAVLLRSLPSAVSWRRLPAAGATDLLSDTTIRVRSGGSELGSVRFPRGRRAVLRPTGAGLAVALRGALGWRPVRIVGGLLAVALVTTKVIGARRSR